MPVLANVKHERFAQGVSKGISQRDAYREAGFTGSDATIDAGASRLISTDKVSARIAELLERAAAKTEITVASITERLLAIAAKGEKSNDAPMLAVGRAALMDAAKLNGLVIDKSVRAETSLEELLDGLDGQTEQPQATAH